MSADFVDEVVFASAYIEMAPHNESAWNFLLGLYRKESIPLAKDGVVEFRCRQILSHVPHCRFALSTLLDVLEGRLEEIYRKGLQKGNDNALRASECASECGCHVEEKEESLGVVQKEVKEEAQRVCDQLVLADPIRAGYWRYRRNLIMAGKLDRVDGKKMDK